MKADEKKEEDKKRTEQKKEENKKEEKGEEKKEEKKEADAEADPSGEAAKANLREKQKEQEKKFLDAARFNSPAELEEQIQGGVNANCKDKEGWTALMHACVQGHEDIVRILLKKRSIPGGLLSIDDKKDIEEAKNDQDEKTRQYTPLHWASNKGHLRIVWLLLNHHFSLTDEDPFGGTAVHQAAAGGAVKVLECFLSLGVDIEKKNTRGHTPLDLASDPETRQLIMKAIGQKQCGCGAKFDFTNVRHYCCKCHKFCCKECCDVSLVDETIDSVEKERPLCLCKQCLDEKKLFTKMLEDALNNGEFDGVNKVLKMIENKKAEVEVKKLHQLRRHHATLMHELKIRTFYRSLDVVPNYKTIKKSVHQLNEMVREALEQKIELSQAIIAEVNQCTKRLLAERDLRLHIDLYMSESAEVKKRDTLQDLFARAREANVSDDYLKVADVLSDKMSKNIRAKEILDRFQAYPERVYPEPEIIDPKKKKKKEEKKAPPKRKKREPPFLIPDWATDLTEVVKEVDTMNQLIRKADEIRLDKEFLSKVQAQLARFKKEIAYRKQLEAEAKAAAEAKLLAKKQKKKK